MHPAMDRKKHQTGGGVEENNFKLFSAIYVQRECDSPTGIPPRVRRRFWASSGEICYFSRMGRDRQSEKLHSDSLLERVRVKSSTDRIGVRDHQGAQKK